MMTSQRFVQLAQADAAPSSTLFPTSNHYFDISPDYGVVFAGAVGGASAA
jgi:hypothetical protein